MDGLDDRLMADIACLDPIYADGVLGLVNLGTTFMEVFYRWRPLRAEGGVLIQERTASHVIVRPLASVTAGGSYHRILSAQTEPALAARLVRAPGVH